MIRKKHHPSSFRDPSGYVYVDEGVIKRTINSIYFKQYYSLKDSGFFDKLFNNKVLIPHKELTHSSTEIIIQPEQIPFITYPYEWSFNQYKEAALLTLRLQKYSLENGFSLKDASAFNVTFHKGKAIFIDTLSFDFYIENSPWRAYKQFISHFLGPLVLTHHHGAQSLKLMSKFLDGMPLKMLASMLPLKAKLNPFIYTNIYLLAKYEDKHSKDYNSKTKASQLSKKSQLNIIKSLYSFIKKLELKESSEWGNYYGKINYSSTAFDLKAKIIDVWVTNLKPSKLIDIGGNDGTFIRQISCKLEQALVCDIDNNAVDINYIKVKENKENYITPFVLDILNPSSAIGFNSEERFSFLERIQKFIPEITLALALIHHMTLSGNVTFNMSANFFASFSKHLIIEFPKRDDSWVERLLNSKADFKEYFNFYSIENFEKAYSKYFDIIEKKEISGTKRCLFLMKKKEDA